MYISMYLSSWGSCSWEIIPFLYKVNFAGGCDGGLIHISLHLLLNCVHQQIYASPLGLGGGWRGLLCIHPHLLLNSIHNKICVLYLSVVVVVGCLLHIHVCLLLNCVHRQIYSPPFGVGGICGRSAPCLSTSELCSQTNLCITCQGGNGCGRSTFLSPYPHQ